MNDPYWLLSYWMSHVGQGQSQRLFDAMQAVQPDTAQEKNRENARFFLDASIRAGHAWMPKTDNWRMRPSAIVMLPDGEGAFWRGGLSPSLRQRIEGAAPGGVLVGRCTKNAPPTISLSGSVTQMENLAACLGVRFETQAAAQAASALPPIESCVVSSMMPTTQVEKISVVWTPGESGADAGMPVVRQFKPDNGRVRYFACDEGMVSEAGGKWEAIYFAARRRHKLCHYSEAERRFETDVAARLPRGYALPLCLCSGALPTSEAGTQVYRHVPPAVGFHMLERLGQDRFRTVLRWF